MTYRISLLITLILGLFLPFHATANTSNEFIIEYLKPTAEKLSLTDIQKTSEWKTSNDGWIAEHMSEFTFWFGDNPKVVWVKLTQNPTATNVIEAPSVELASSGVSRAKLFFKTGQWQQLDSDQLAARAELGEVSKHFMPSRHLTFNLDRNWTNSPIYIRVEATHKFHLQINIAERNLLLSENLKTETFFFFCYGILFVMAFYNLVIGRYLQDKLYYFYSFTIVITLIYQFFAHGHARLFGHFNWDYVNHGLNFFAMMSAWTAMVFLYYFVNARHYAPRFAKFYRSFLSFFAVSGTLTLVLPTNTSLNIALLIAGPTPLFAMVFALWVWRRGSKAAGIFILAWSFYIFGGFLWVLYWMGLVSLNLSVELPLLVGASLESILLSLALGYRIQLMRKQRSELKQSESYYKTISALDPLTQLANRRAFDKHLDDLNADNQTFSLVLLDIDHFKSFNDNYGHQAGDKVIQSLGEILQHTVRDNDLAARIGGEEFALIILNDNVEVSRTIAERIRVRFAETPYKVNNEVVYCTVSVGIAIIEEGETNEALIKRTDEALYRAKDKGRDQVQISVTALAS